MVKRKSAVAQGTRISELLRRWGHAVSLGLYNPDCLFFEVPGIEGVIGYRLIARCAVVYGNPVCQPYDMGRLMKAFDDYCRARGYRVVYVAASAACLSWPHTQSHYGILEIGTEIILDPADCPRHATGRRASVLRNKYNQSLRAGLTVAEYCGGDGLLEEALEQLGKTWQQNRPRRQLYLYPLDLFLDRANKRWFYVTHKDHLVAALMLNRLDCYDGWVINMLMLTPMAPATTSEFLVMSVLDILAEEGCRFFSIGSLPGSPLRAVKGFSPRYLSSVNLFYERMHQWFSLHDRQRYWQKFQPRQEPSFLLLNRRYFGVREMIALLRTFSMRLF